MRRVFRLVGMTLAALILSGQPGVLAPARFIHLSQAAGTLLLVPSQGSPGTQISVLGATGAFPAGKPQLIVFRDPNGSTNTTLGRVQAAADGSFSGMFSIPAQASGGVGFVFVQFYPESATPFTVLPTLAVTPTVAFPGTLVTVTGSGYKALASVVLSLDGVIVPLPTASTDLFGNFQTTVALPLTLLGGQHTLNVSDGTVTSTETSATVSVIGPTATPTITQSPTATAIPTATSTPVATVAFPSATPSSGGSTTVYLAEGYTGTAAGNGKVSFFEALNIVNPGDAPAPVTITYYVAGFPLLPVRRSVPAQGTLQESVATDVGADKIVSAMVTSPRRVYVSRTIARFSAAGQRLDGSTTAAEQALATSWDFAEGYTGVSFQEYLTLFNPSYSAATVRVLLAPQGESAAGTPPISLRVPAGGRVTANIRALNTGKARSIGMLVRSTVPIAAERVLYFGAGSGSAKFGSTVSAGLAAPANELTVPFGSSGGTTRVGGLPQALGDQEFITLLNPGPAQAAVVAQAMDAAGHLLGKQSSPVVLAAGTRQTIGANALVGAAGPFSLRLLATSPVEAEAAQYFAGSPNVGSHPGMALPALSSPVSVAYLTDLGSAPGPSGTIGRRIYLQNPGPSPIEVQVRYFSSTGPSAQHLYSIPAHGIATVDVGHDLQLVPGGAVGAELRLTAGAGGFLAVSIGLTADGRAAYEESAIPAG